MAIDVQSEKITSIQRSAGPVPFSGWPVPPLSCTKLVPYQFPPVNDLKTKRIPDEPELFAGKITKKS